MSTDTRVRLSLDITLKPEKEAELLERGRELFELEAFEAWDSFDVSDAITAVLHFAPHELHVYASGWAADTL